MVEITTRRCFVLWTQDKNGNSRFEPVVFTSAHAAITEGERQVEKRLCKNYNYSVVMEPEIGEEIFLQRPLTSEPRMPNISM